MFSMEEIQAAHAKVKSGADFPSYIREIKQLGVFSYETYVRDGHTDYYGENDYKISSSTKYEPLKIAEKNDLLLFKKGLKEHQQGKTDYSTFCSISARTGIEKWIVETGALTCTYYNASGSPVLEEKIPQ